LSKNQQFQKKYLENSEEESSNLSSDSKASPAQSRNKNGNKKAQTLNTSHKVQPLQSTLQVPSNNNQRRNSINLSEMVKIEFKGGMSDSSNIIGLFGNPEKVDFKRMVTNVLQKSPR
jgi:FKBP-type peptidyl-prolyl cis-trans isomerase